MIKIIGKPKFNIETESFFDEGLWRSGKITECAISAVCAKIKTNTETVRVVNNEAYFPNRFVVWKVLEPRSYTKEQKAAEVDLFEKQIHERGVRKDAHGTYYVK